MLRNINWGAIALLFVTMMLIPVGCKQNKMPKLSFTAESNVKRDTSMMLLLFNNSQQESMTIPAKKQGKTFVVQPDTMLYKEAVFYTNGGSKKMGFRLSQGAWIETSADSLLLKYIHELSGNEVATVTGNEFSAQDAYGNLLSSYDLYKKYFTAIIFCSTDALTAQDSAKLKAAIDSLHQDSVRRIYMVMTPNNQEAIAYAKADSAKAVVFSDSLGVVSEMRERMGIKRSSGIILIDTLGQRVPIKQ